MALGFLGDLLGLNKGNATKAAANQNKTEIGKYDTRANSIINTGEQKAGGYLEQAMGLYDPIKSSTGMYADAVGLNGADGAGRASEAFTVSPGYDFSLNQGLQALDRNASARGSFQSGGAMTDVMDYATGAASREHGSWLDRLAGLSGAAIQGQTGTLGNLANLATGASGQRLNVAGGVTSSRMGANNQFAEGEEANKAGLASLGSNLIGMAAKPLGFNWGGF